MRIQHLLAVTLLVTMGIAGPARAATSDVNVELIDTSSTPKAKDMGVKLDVDHVPAGKVTFHVQNLSATMVHEMIVVPVTDASADLPYNATSQRVIEKKIQSKGEVAELKPGKAGTLSVTLVAGAYKLMCNQPNHFHRGMWADFTVTP
jgi:uncharacterized cupredoxin-like copper-binding protein